MLQLSEPCSLPAREALLITLTRCETAPLQDVNCFANRNHSVVISLSHHVHLRVPVHESRASNDVMVGSMVAQHIGECTLTLIQKYAATTRDADFCFSSAVQTGFHPATNMRHLCSISQTVRRFTADTSKAGKERVLSFPPLLLHAARKNSSDASCYVWQELGGGGAFVCTRLKSTVD